MHLKLKTKLQLYFALIGIFSVSLTSVIFFYNAKSTLEKISFERLTSIRETKKKLIENYFDQLKNLTLILAGNDNIIRNLDNPSLLNSKHANLSGDILGMKEISSRFDIEDILLVNTKDYKLIFSLNRKDITGLSILSESITNGIKSSVKECLGLKSKDSIYINDFELNRIYVNKPSAFISAPVYSGKNIKGVIILQLSVDYINQIMTNNNSWREIGFGETAETYIVGPDFKMRTDSRFFIQEPDKYFSMLRKKGTPEDIINKIVNSSSSILLQEVKTTASIDGANGMSNTKIIYDYRGVEVISAYTPLQIANLKWTLLSEIDTGEAFGTITSLKEYLILAGLLIILLASALGVIISRNISKPIISLTRTAEIFGKGNLEYRAESLSKDEFSLLFSTFNTMAEKIMKNTEHLKLEIEDRKRISEELRTSREQLRSLSSHLQSVREEERKLIAREIHDELGQALNTLKLKISILKNEKGRKSSKSETNISEIFSLIDNTIHSIRRIITELRPQLIDDLGITAAIEWQVNEFQKNSGIKCSLQITPEEIKIDSDKAIALFRILQEALTNIGRHSGATHVLISLTEKDENLRMYIKDNGKGLKNETQDTSKSFGLLGIRERARYFGGSVVIESPQGEGVTIIADFPHIKEAL